MPGVPPGSVLRLERRHLHASLRRQRLEGDAQPHSGCGGEAFEGAGRGLDAAAFEARDDRLGRVHAIGELLLRQPGAGARLDQRRRKRELVFERVVRLDIIRILAPLGEGFSTGIILLIRPPVRANSISRRGVR